MFVLISSILLLLQIFLSYFFLSFFFKVSFLLDRNLRKSTSFIQFPMKYRSIKKKLYPASNEGSENFVIDFNRIKTAPTYPNLHLANHRILSMFLIKRKVLYNSFFQCTIKLHLEGIFMLFTLSVQRLFLIIFVGGNATLHTNGNQL